MIYTFSTQVTDDICTEELATDVVKHFTKKPPANGKIRFALDADMERKLGLANGILTFNPKVTKLAFVSGTFSFDATLSFDELVEEFAENIKEMLRPELDKYSPVSEGKLRKIRKEQQIVTTHYPQFIAIGSKVEGLDNCPEEVARLKEVLRSRYKLNVQNDPSGKELILPAITVNDQRLYRKTIAI